jgi:hypothetical protein
MSKTLPAGFFRNTQAMRWFEIRRVDQDGNIGRLEEKAATFTGAIKALKLNSDFEDISPNAFCIVACDLITVGAEAFINRRDTLETVQEEPSQQVGEDGEESGGTAEGEPVRREEPAGWSDPDKTDG